MEIKSRKPTRIPGYDYSKCNYYFITICTHNKKCIFGTADQLSPWGCIARDHIRRIEENYPSVRVNPFIVMPNHVHMILEMDDSENNPDITMLIGLYKTGVTKEIRRTNPDVQVWQRSFHDHIIRNQRSYERIWNYVVHNYEKWEQDCFYMATENE